MCITHSVTLGSIAASSAVAPAGGYTVPVIVIAADAIPTDKPAARNLNSSYCPLSRKSLVILIPMAAARSSPRIAFRGCASGEDRVLNWRIAAAP